MTADPKSLWQLDDDPPVPRATLPARADVVIVGAGVTGISLAMHLVDLSPTLRVVVVDRGEVASGASGRNAGMLLLGTSDRYATAVARFGRARARALWQASHHNHDLLAGWASTHGIACDHDRRGSLQLAATAEEADVLRESATLLAQDGFSAHFDSTAPAPYVAGWAGALFTATDGCAHPRRLLRGLARLLTQRGVAIVDRCDVTHVDHDTNVTRVTTSDGTVEAGAVVVCTNAWATRLTGLAVQPVRAQMLATAPAAEPLDVPVYARWGHDYWRRLPDGRIILGGCRDLDVAGENDDALALHAAIQDELGRLLGTLTSAPIVHRWSGIMGFTPSGLPWVGRIGDTRAWVCAGFSGHGFGLGAALAERVAHDIVHGATHDLAWLAPTAHGASRDAVDGALIPPRTPIR